MLGRHDSIEEVTVQLGSLGLHGTLGVPQGPVGVVVVAHGSGSSRSSPRNTYLARSLRARGIATLLVDLLTEQEELVDRIDATLRCDVELLASRLLGVTDWLGSAKLPHLPLAYVGAGAGAAAALIAASRRPGLVRAIVARGGRPDLAPEALPLVRAPTLFIVGGNDLPLLEVGREAISQMTTPTQLVTIPGAGHLFEEPGALEDVAQLAAEWLVDHFAQAFAERPARPPSWMRQFRDRREAGARLAEALWAHASERVVVFGLPRGGMPVADEIAKALHAPLDAWLVRKLGMPIQPELGMGALAEGAALVLDPNIVRWAAVTPDQLLAIVHGAAADLRRRAQVYRGSVPPPSVEGRTVILVDDGIATGGTLRAAVRGARKRGAARVIVAAPVAAAEALASLREDADACVCLSTPQQLVAVSAWYQDFPQVSEDEVVDILGEARRRSGTNAGAGKASAGR